MRRFWRDLNGYERALFSTWGACVVLLIFFYFAGI